MIYENFELEEIKNAVISLQTEVSFFSEFDIFKQKLHVVLHK